MANGDFYSIPVMENEKDRALEFNNNAMKNGLPPPAIPAVAPTPSAMAPQVTPQANAAAGLAKAVNAIQPTQTGFETFKKSLEEQSPFRQKVQSQIEGNMGGAQAGQLADQQATQARTQMSRNVQSEAEARRQEAIRLGLGGNQLANSQNLFKDQALVANQDLEGSLAADKTKNIFEAQKQAIQDALRLREAGTAEASALGQLQQSELESQRDVQKTDKEIQLQQLMQDKTLSWEEKKQRIEQQFAGDEAGKQRAFQSLEAGLDRDVQQLMQDKTLSWEEKKQRIEQQFAGDEAGKQRAFQSLEAGLDRENQNKLLDKNLSWEERKQAGDQVFASKENALNRTLDTLLTDKRIAADIGLKTMDQTFTERITKDGWMNEKEMFKMKEELEKSLLATGISADEAKQISEQNHQLLVQKNTQKFETDMEEYRQKFMNGERIDSQNYDILKLGIVNQQQETMAKLEQELETLTIDKRALVEKDLQNFLKTKDYLMQKALLGDKKAIDKEIMKLENNYAKSLQNNGMTNEKALLALKHANDMAMQDDEQLHLTNIATAQMAQEDEHFASQLGLDLNELQIRKLQIKGELDLAAKRLDLDTKQLDILQEDKEFIRAMDIAATGLELAGDDPAAMAPFVQMMSEAIKKGAEKLGLDTSAFTKYAQDLEAKTLGETAPAKVQEAKTRGDIVKALMATGMSEKDAWTKGLGLGDEFDYMEPEEKERIYAKPVMPSMRERSAALATTTLEEKRPVSSVVKFTTNKTGDSVASLNGKSSDAWSNEEWTSVISSPAQVENLKEEGIIIKQNELNPGDRGEIGKFINKYGKGTTQDSGGNYVFAKPIPYEHNNKVYMIKHIQITEHDNAPGRPWTDLWTDNRVYGYDPKNPKDIVLIDSSSYAI